MHRFRDPVVWAGVLLAIGSFFVYWLSNRAFDAGRGDLFYLADSFLHGHTWIGLVPGPFDVITFNGHIVRAVRAVPGHRPDAARRADRARGRGPVGIRDQRAARLDRRPDGLVGLGADRRVEDPRPPGDGAAARLLDPDLVGHDPRRRVAHGPPRRDDPHAVPARRDVRPQARRADGPARRRRVPDAGAARVRGTGRRAVADPDGRPTRPCGRAASAAGSRPSRGAHGSCSRSASSRPWSSSSGTTSTASATRCSPAMRSRRCPTGSRTCGTRGCSRPPTSR